MDSEAGLYVLVLPLVSHVVCVLEGTLGDGAGVLGGADMDLFAISWFLWFLSGCLGVGNEKQECMHPP